MRDEFTSSLARNRRWPRKANVYRLAPRTLRRHTVPMAGTRKPSGTSRRRKRGVPELGGLTATAHPFNNVDHAALKAALLEHARESRDALPGKVEVVRALLRGRDPIHIVASVASYALRARITSEGVEETGNPVQQHHVELLQALLLTLPREDWGHLPAEPETIQKTMDALVELIDARMASRLVEMEAEKDLQATTMRSLQERLRGQTEVVRNWGYHSAIVDISTALFAPLDEALASHHGFSAGDLIQIADAMVTAYQQASSTRQKTLWKILRGRTIRQVVRLFFSRYMGTGGDPETFLKAVPAGATLDEVRYNLMILADLDLASMAFVDLEDIAGRTGHAVELVRSVLERLSHTPGNQVAARTDYFFLGNPVWTRPGLEVDGRFFFPTPQAVFSHINAILRTLIDEAGLKAKFEKRRAKYLEAAIGDVIRRLLPDADIRLNAQWHDGETDLLVQIDKTVLIVEAKSHTVTAEGLRGAPDRIKRHVQDLVVEPARQSARLESLIREAGNGDARASAIVTGLGVDAARVDTVVRLSVTLDDLSVISSSETELKQAGWVPDDLRLAPTLSLADFQVVATILENPAHFLHYFAERERIQKTADILGDELDYLGFYLSTGFNVASIEASDMRLVISGLSGPIDRYYVSQEAGIRLSKPRPEITKELERIIERVQARSVPGWTTIAIDLLRMGNLKEQREVFKMVEQLRREVPKTFRDPGHNSTVSITGPAHREACILFYVFPRALQGGRREAVHDLGAQVLRENGRRRCVAIGKMVEDWDEPYQFIGVLTENDQG